ncbi:MAG: GxxExxY protein [Verrucomicrobia bacterium]|nr:GxxExxY protein [Verrucomicrobiota bacterium]
MINAETQRRRDAEKVENLLSEQVIDAAIEVHKVLGGPGLLESLYADALYHELKLRDIPVQSQVQIPVIYKNHRLRDPMRLDLLVGHKVIIEIKAKEQELDVHKAQVLTYLRLTGLRLGLVLNFGQGRLLDGLTRVANGL